jgi:ketosteroid isomerase-like protein
MAKKTKKAARKAPKRVARTAAKRAPRPQAKKPTPAKRPAAAAPKASPVRALAQRIVDVTLSNNDDAAFALYADTVESTEMGQPPMTGLDAIRQKFAMWRGMITDSAWTAQNVWVDGNTILIEWVGRVTLAANGRQVDLREIAIYEVAGGKIVRERFYYDPSLLRP